MYRAYNLTEDNWEALYRDIGITSHNRNKSAVKSSLISFLKNGVIDGTELKEHWFPPIQADVFISHSHNDEDHAIRFAGWLKKHLGLESFIDSCVWGHADELQKAIDNDYCFNLPDKETYDYEKRNRSTSHVHMMLAAALCEMLDSTECVFFLNTENSISSVKDTISKTKSPWLFYELGAIRTLRRRKPDRQIVLLENMSRHMKKSAAALDLEYSVPLNCLTSISLAELDLWKNHTTSKGSGVLDLLYDWYTEQED